jgi:hypothetical protein
MTLSPSLDARLAHLECITLCTKAQLRRGQGVGLSHLAFALPHSSF